jgi:hypothetical protein
VHSHTTTISSYLEAVYKAVDARVRNGYDTFQPSDYICSLSSHPIFPLATSRPSIPRSDVCAGH